MSNAFGQEGGKLFPVLISAVQHELDDYPNIYLPPRISSSDKDFYRTGFLKQENISNMQDLQDHRLFIYVIV